MIKLKLKKNQGPARTGFRGGFTLLETLVAISILMVAVVAPITIAQRGLSSAVYSKNQMIASYLAQDAIEYIKNKRDEITIKNINNNLGWEDLSFFSLCFGENGCQIDTLTRGTDEAVEPFSKSQPLKKDKGNGLYSYSNTNIEDGKDSEETNFTRKINIELQPVIGVTSALDQALITVTVNWGESNEVVVKTLMYNY